MQLRSDTAPLTRSPMERFARASAKALRERRAELTVQPLSGDGRFTVELFGLMTGGRLLCVSAPANADKSLIAVMPGQLLRCRWINPKTVFQFDASVKKLAFEPVPMLHLGDIHAIQSRELRGLPRARAALPASLRTPSPMAALVTDLSVSGAQIATSGGPGLAAGDAVELSLRHSLFRHEFTLTLRCHVAADQGTIDREHPAVHFYGLVFDEPSENEQLILHGIVQEHLAQEADRLGQLLLLTEAGTSP